MLPKIKEVFSKPYRIEYEEQFTSLIEERILCWLEPVGEWDSKLTNQIFDKYFYG
jgi:hypothetical protein